MKWFAKIFPANVLAVEICLSFSYHDFKLNHILLYVSVFYLFVSY